MNLLVVSSFWPVQLSPIAAGEALNNSQAISKACRIPASDHFRHDGQSIKVD